MKNLKLFENFSGQNNNESEEAGQKVPVSLSILFGTDQAFTVENILNDLQDQKHVTKWDTETKDKHTKFDIEFTSAYGVYLFGHMQGALRMRD